MRTLTSQIVITFAKERKAVFDIVVAEMNFEFVLRA